MSSRTCLVTGCSSGFGRAIALHLARKGATVVATMRDVASRNQEAAEQLRGVASKEDLSLQVLELDVTDAASIRRCAEQTEAHGGVDTLVLNAGVAAAGWMEAFSSEVLHRMFDVNVYGPHRVLRAFLPQLRARGDGVVVAISSTDGREVMPFLGIYNASKAALEGLMESWRYELGVLGIRTCIVQPGTFPTTSILNNLLPPDAPERVEAYGASADAPAQLFKGIEDMVAAGQAPDPSLVADAVWSALDAEAPTRLVVDPSGFDGAERINAVCAEVQGELLGRFGLQWLDEAAD